MKDVIIIQRIIPHYRIAFYNALYKKLLSQNIKLTVIYGQEKANAVPKSVFVEQPWAVQIKNKYYSILGKEVVWQPCLSFLKGADLIIFEQANRLLINYLLLSRLFIKKTKLAFWGHGGNFQSNKKNGLLEKWKKRFNNAVDWWFTYTELSTELIASFGFPEQKITTVYNSIDDSELCIAKENMAILGITDIKCNLNITSEHTAIYCGGMYEEKRISFLLEACYLIKQKVPDFNIIFIGTGPDHSIVINAAVNNAWVHDLGYITGVKRVPYFMVSQLFLLPGAVGLAILDSFILGTPLVTTTIKSHGPEISYLEHDENGLMVKDDLNEYATVVINTLLSSGKLLSLKKGCVNSAQKYTLDNMVDNYTNGIIRCLDK